MKNINGIMMQYFEWYLNCAQGLWNKALEEAEELAKNGITALWLPPAYKGVGGDKDVGYGVYDVYDLGEFNQKGAVKTKYGYKDEYLKCIEVLKKNNIEVYADIVLNHKMGADIIQTIPATRVEWCNHNFGEEIQEYVKVATKFIFPGRNDKYSNFHWNWTHFDGIDYNEATKENRIYKFKDKTWDDEVDEEFGNFDYLMGADIDFSNLEVIEECIKWAKWYLDITGVNGFRLDAVKHISADFYKNFIQVLREDTGKELFTVGEYWSGDISKLHRYITETEGRISLFDVPLHYNLYRASVDENYDLSKIFEGTLVKENPNKAVTFVDNHDTQPSQALQSFIYREFKDAAYSLILLRNEGYPCVFYGDYYGIPHDNIAALDNLKLLITLRKEKAYGEQHDYFDNPNYIGWTREGDEENEKSSLAVVITNRGDGEKYMYIGTKNAGKIYIDALGNVDEEVIINEQGCRNF